MAPFPTQLLDSGIDLEAIDEDRNVRRSYSITASPDLFGQIIVELRWGRIGRRGRTMILSFHCPQAAAKFVSRTLKRRATAEKRLGVAYRSK